MSLHESHLPFSTWHSNDEGKSHIMCDVETLKVWSKPSAAARKASNCLSVRVCLLTRHHPRLSSVFIHTRQAKKEQASARFIYVLAQLASQWVRLQCVRLPLALTIDRFSELHNEWLISKKANSKGKNTTPLWISSTHHGMVNVSESLFKTLMWREDLDGEVEWKIHRAI